MPLKAPLNKYFSHLHAFFCIMICVVDQLKKIVWWISRYTNVSPCNFGWILANSLVAGVLAMRL
jgi:hypothetical protein